MYARLVFPAKFENIRELRTTAVISYAKSSKVLLHFLLWSGSFHGHLVVMFNRMRVPIGLLYQKKKKYMYSHADTLRWDV